MYIPPSRGITVFFYPSMYKPGMYESGIYQPGMYEPGMYKPGMLWASDYDTMIFKLAKVA